MKYMLFILAAVAAVLGILQLLQKGPLLNNAYLFATKSERAAMDKKPHYIQSGIVFVLLALFLLISGVFAMTGEKWALYTAGAVAIVDIFYAGISGLVINKDKK